ncbi:MAG: hypothetical protein NTW85_09635 [Methylococcales bacterium]|nr:hypothetical protein [Methylococcales bacterium]
MKTNYKYVLLFLLLIAHQNGFSAQENNAPNNIYVKAFPNNDINYFYNNNNAESWRLAYGKLVKPPYDPNNSNDCNSDEGGSDQALSFNIAEFIKNAGDRFDIHNIHAYYDGDSGKKALALRLHEWKIKKSMFAMASAIAEVLIRKENSKYMQLTESRLSKPLPLLNDNEENIMYICFGYLQHFATTESEKSKDGDMTNKHIVDPEKIVFWYDGSKATPIPNPKLEKQPKLNKAK